MPLNEVFLRPQNRSRLKPYYYPVLPFLVFLEFLGFLALQGIPCFFERFSLLFQGFWGFGRDKKSLFFWWFSLPFSKKNKERKDRVKHYYRRQGFLAPRNAIRKKRGFTSGTLT